jgi:hypothetical protein
VPLAASDSPLHLLSTPSPVGEFSPTLTSLWGDEERCGALSDALHDLLHFDNQLLTQYKELGDQEWQLLINHHLISGTQFQAGSFQRQMIPWFHYLSITNLLQNRTAAQCMQWIEHGYQLRFGRVDSEANIAHPRFQQRLTRATRALQHLSLPQHVSFFLSGSEPHPVRFPNHASVADHQQFVRDELNKFISIGALRVMDQTEYSQLVVHPMSVAVNADGKKRLCVDANYINIFEQYAPVHYELLPQVLPILQEGDWFFVTDMTKGYLHCALHPDSQRFLCVSFENVTYGFLAMPFGLQSAPQAYCSLMYSMYLPWRRLNRRFSFMIDDRIGVERSRAACWLHIYSFIRIACALGVHFGLEKCLLWPCKVCKYLGLILDVQRMKVYIPEAKVRKFSTLVADIIHNPSPTARSLASLAGMLVGFYPALPFGPLLTRLLYNLLIFPDDWEDPVSISSPLSLLLSWLPNYISSHNGKRMIQRTPTMILVSDASVSGLGGQIHGSVSPGVWIQIRSQFPQELWLSSSTCREVAAMVEVLKTLLSQPSWHDSLCHGSIKFLSDNQAAVSDVLHMRGTSQVFPHIQELYSLAASHDFDIHVEWRPREDPLIQVADALSKEVDYGDWGVSSTTYKHICSMFSVCPQIDWFAAPWNAKCAKFFSLHLTPGCSGVNAWDFCWHTSDCQMSWICPPHMLISRTLSKILRDKASCVLLLPAWFKVWHNQLCCLPISQQTNIHSSCIDWGPRAPPTQERCAALSCGLIAYKIVFPGNM